MKQFLISPPFGTYLSHPDCTSVIGTFTYKYRPGRFWRIIKTVRPYKDGWRNDMGLRNPGIYRADKSYNSSALLTSVTAFHLNEWHLILEILPTWSMVELNVSCPNANTLTPTAAVIRRYSDKFQQISIKVPPTKFGVNTAIAAMDQGITHVHMANSLRIEGIGGFSAPSNMPLVLPKVELLASEIKKRGHNKVRVIGGHGIRTVEDIQKFHDAGANHFSISTGWMNPFKTRKAIKAWKERE